MICAYVMVLLLGILCISLINNGKHVIVPLVWWYPCVSWPNSLHMPFSRNSLVLGFLIICW